MKADGIPDFLDPTPNPVTLTPITPMDAILPSGKDVTSIPPERELVASGELQDVKDVSGKGVDVLKPLIPLKPKPTWPNWSIDYLKAIIACRTDGEAARRIGLSYQTVYEARLSFVDYATAWDACRKYRDSKIVSDLEDASFQRALLCDPNDRMSASLNMFHLKARDDRYKDKAASIVGGITINLGYQIPTTTRQVGPIVEAQFDD